MMRNKAFIRVRAALDAEREALLAGNLSALHDIADRKERALVQLAANRPAEADIETLQALAIRNQTLLDGASAAIADVRDFITRARRPPDTLTYGADGTRQALAAPRHGLTQKA